MFSQIFFCVNSCFWQKVTKLMLKAFVYNVTIFNGKLFYY